MQQQRVGSFLKELRKEKNLTQEQLAEQLNVSGRTVSRWETGSNMPDISILVDLAESYNVSIPEIIDGERRSEQHHHYLFQIFHKYILLFTLFTSAYCFADFTINGLNKSKNRSPVKCL